MTSAVRVSQLRVAQGMARFLQFPPSLDSRRSVAPGGAMPVVVFCQAKESDMSVSSRSRLLVILLASVQLGGCASVMSPRVTPVTPVASSDVDAAKGRLQQVITELDKGIEEHMKFEFWSGAGLLGIGLGATTLGAFSGSRDAILGTAALGAAVTAGRTYIPIQERKAIYEQGIAALQCGRIAVDRTPPADVGGAPKIVTFLNSSDTELEKASMALQAQYSIPAATVVAASARDTLASRQELRQALSRVTRLLDFDDAAKVRMLDSVTVGVVQTVNLQLLAHGPKLDAAMDTVKTTFGAREKELAEAGKKLREAANAVAKDINAVKATAAPAVESANAQVAAAETNRQVLSQQVESSAALARHGAPFGVRGRMSARVDSLEARRKDNGDAALAASEQAELVSLKDNLAMMDTTHKLLVMEADRAQVAFTNAAGQEAQIKKDAKVVEEAANTVQGEADETEPVANAALDIAAALEILTKSAVPAKCFEALIGS